MPTALLFGTRPLLDLSIAFPVALSWADVATAGSTIVLAVFAIVSAYYAKKLWIEAQKQFGELRRSTDMDISLRMLHRCDDTKFLEAEDRIVTLAREGYLADVQAYAKWALAQPDKFETFKVDFREVLTTYEHIGIVVRKTPGIRDIIIDYLCLRAPQMYDYLKLFIELNRETSQLSNQEFENLAKDCRTFAQQSGALATPAATDAIQPPAKD